MKVIELKKEMDGLFAQVEVRFAQVDERFAQVDARFAQVDARFEQVDARFVQVDTRFEQVLERVALEGEATRRHFDIVAEQMRAEIRLALEHSVATSERVDALAASNAREHAQLDRRLVEHDVRLTRLESS